MISYCAFINAWFLLMRFCLWCELGCHHDRSRPFRKGGLKLWEHFGVKTRGGWRASWQVWTCTELASGAQSCSILNRLYRLILNVPGLQGRKCRGPGFIGCICIRFCIHVASYVNNVATMWTQHRSNVGPNGPTVQVVGVVGVVTGRRSDLDQIWATSPPQSGRKTPAERTARSSGRGRAARSFWNTF